MAKRKTTIYVDEDLLRRARVFAARTGKRDSEVVEEALRSLLGIDVLAQVWARSDLNEEEAMALASEALREVRQAQKEAERASRAGAEPTGSKTQHPSRRATG